MDNDQSNDSTRPTSPRTELTRMLLGYIPALVVTSPILSLIVHQWLYFRGAKQNGLELISVGFIVFVVGGLLNIGFLLCYWSNRTSWGSFREKWKVRVATGSIVCAEVMFVFQASAVLLFLLASMVSA